MDDDRSDAVTYLALSIVTFLALATVALVGWMGWDEYRIKAENAEASSISNPFPR